MVRVERLVGGTWDMRVKVGLVRWSKMTFYDKLHTSIEEGLLHI